MEVSEAAQETDMEADIKNSIYKCNMFLNLNNVIQFFFKDYLLSPISSIINALVAKIADLHLQIANLS